LDLQAKQMYRFNGSQKNKVLTIGDRFTRVSSKPFLHFGQSFFRHIYLVIGGKNRWHVNKINLWLLSH